MDEWTDRQTERDRKTGRQHHNMICGGGLWGGVVIKENMATAKDLYMNSLVNIPGC